MTLAQLAITVALLGVLGLAASRLGLSAIPAYLLAGLLLGPNEPKDLSIIRPSEVTDFVAELGLVLGFAGGGGGAAGQTLAAVGKAVAFLAFSLAASRWLPPSLDRLLAPLPREFFLLGTVAFVVGMAALAHWLGLSEAIGALMA